MSMRKRYAHSLSVVNAWADRALLHQNDEKITRCLSQCMNGDARRRFAYGFTIEDSWMRLWYCDRMQMIVSESFNFVHVSLENDRHIYI